MNYKWNFFDIDVQNNDIDDNIEIKSECSMYMKNIKNIAKVDKCLLCGEQCTSLCNSHTIPQFIIKKLSGDGHFYYINSLIGQPFSKQALGTKEAMTFNLICNKCDQTYFSTYENSKNYSNCLTQKLLAEVALKNNLRMLSKRLVEKQFYLDQYKNCKNSSVDVKSVTSFLTSNELDTKELYKSIKLAKDTICGKKTGYYLIDYITLEYIAKMAYQGKVALITGFDNEVINDIYYSSENYKIQCLHISVFPIENKTHIFLFIEDGDNRYSKFYKKFRKLSLNDKLKVVNYIIIKYSEDWLLSSKIEKDLLNSQSLVKEAKATAMLNVFSDLPYFDENRLNREALNSALTEFSLANIPEIPNFLLNM